MVISIDNRAYIGHGFRAPHDPDKLKALSERVKAFTEEYTKKTGVSGVWGVTVVGNANSEVVLYHEDASVLTKIVDYVQDKITKAEVADYNRQHPIDKDYDTEHYIWRVHDAKACDEQFTRVRLLAEKYENTHEMIGVWGVSKDTVENTVTLYGKDKEKFNAMLKYVKENLGEHHKKKHKGPRR